MRDMKLSSLIVTAVLLCASSLSQARPAVVFSCGIPTNLPQWQTLTTLYRNAFDALGYDFSMVYLNTKREIYEHKYSDKYDGICARTPRSIEELKQYNLVMVDSPVGDPSTVLWRYKASTKPGTSDKPMLQAHTKVGYLRGNSLSKTFIDEFADVTAVTFIKPNLGMKSLAAGRVDYWIGFSYTADFLAENLNLHDRIEKVGIIRQDFFYPFLHLRLSSLKEPLEQQLKQAMAQRGSLIK